MKAKKPKNLNHFVIRVTLVLESEAATPQEAVEGICATMKLDSEQVEVLGRIGQCSGYVDPRLN